MTTDSQLIGQEFLGAELVLGKELIESTGTLWESVEKGGAIQQQHLGWLLEDYGEFWLHALTAPATTPGALKRLIGARVEHVTSTLDSTSQLIENEWAPLTKIWADYLDVVRRDWSPEKT